MSDASLTSDPLATPKTDAVAFRQYDGWICGDKEFVNADFARTQERRITDLEKALRDVRGELEAYSGLKAENQDWSDAFAVISKVLP